MKKSLLVILLAICTLQFSTVYASTKHSATLNLNNTQGFKYYSSRVTYNGKSHNDCYNQGNDMLYLAALLQRTNENGNPNNQITYKYSGTRVIYE